MFEHVFEVKNARTQHIWAAILLVILLVICFWPFVIGDQTLLESARGSSSIMPNGAWAGNQVPVTFNKTKDPGAPSWTLEPLLQLIRKEIRDEKTLPVWNPYQAYGTPLAANMQSQVYYPLTVAASFFHRPKAWNFYLLSRLFLAGIFAYLYARFFVSFLPALAAAITSMFAGYFMLYLSMPHLSVEVLLPALLYAGELIVRHPRFKTATFLAVLVFCVLSGGMPESSFLVLAYTYVYLLIRALTDSDFRAGWKVSAVYLFLSTLSGFGFAGILLVPFRQFMRYSFDTHQFANTGSIIGLVMDRPKLSALTYIFPLLFGPGWDNNLRNYVGITILFLGLFAVVSIRLNSGSSNQRLVSLTCFYTVASVCLVAKRFGSGLVNWIGQLPVFDLILYPKYEEPLLSISLAMLSAIGLERLLHWKVSSTRQLIAFAAAFIPFVVLVRKAWKPLALQARLSDVNAAIAGWSLLLPAVSIILILLVFFAVHSFNISDGARRLSLTAMVFVVLVCETLFNYFVPAYYYWNRSPTTDSNPYVGAPYLNQLRLISQGNRILGQEGVLAPSWASAFNLFDVRALDAMYYHKYLPFVRRFFASAPPPPNVDLYERFVGAENFVVTDALQLRFLQLSSIKYLITYPSNTLKKSAVDDIFEQNAGHLATGKESQVSRQILAIAGISRVALFEHPPYDRLPYHLRVAPGNSQLHFSVGINPAAAAICGDGVGFIVEARDASGEISKLFSQFIDPRHDPATRRWVDGTADLSPYEGKSVDLLLTTDPGPKKDNCADWAFWSDFHFEHDPQNTSFRPIYQGEVNIYEYLHPLPRAAIYYGAAVKPTELEVLKSVSDPNLNVFKDVLLNGAELDSTQSQWVQHLNSLPARNLEAARITSYLSREVTIEAGMTTPGILVLNDSDFPGWTVSVDGHRSKLVSATYMFKGVFLEPGKHVVKFAYEPASLRTGEAITAASLCSFTTFGLYRLRRRRRKATV